MKWEKKNKSKVREIRNTIVGAAILNGVVSEGFIDKMMLKWKIEEAIGISYVYDQGRGKSEGEGPKEGGSYLGGKQQGGGMARMEWRRGRVVGNESKR